MQWRSNERAYNGSDVTVAHKTQLRNAHKLENFSRQLVRQCYRCEDNIKVNFRELKQSI